MKIYIASDHGGYQLKSELISFLSDANYVVEDMGPFEFNSLDDYTDFVFPLAEKVARSKTDLGIVLGRSGNGEAIAANKVKGIRAAVCLNEKMAKKAREDNNANILSMGSDFIDIKKAKRVVSVFVDTEFSALDRHERRLKKISLYEAGLLKGK